MAAISGRPDSRLFKYIYSGGVGGVIDMRLSAHDESSTEKASEVRAKVENGTYRGMEKLMLTVSDGVSVTESDSNISVSGDFTQQVIYGSIADINTIYPDGISGIYGGVAIGAGTSLPRKSIATSCNVVNTTDLGVSWTSSTAAISATTNTATISATGVSVVNYTAQSKQTEVVEQADVLHGEAGLLGVITTQDYNKATYTESVTGIITKSNASGIVTESSQALKVLIDGEIERIKTQLTDMPAPANSSQAVKVAIYQVEENGQMFLYFIANTMTHNGTNWGEDDEMVLTSGSFTDLNGTAQLCSITRTTLPYGWVRNKV